jgi:flagellar biosynthesis protein FliP
LLNRLLLSLSTGLYCTSFSLSNNWYIYSTAQNIFLIVLGTILCSLVILFTSFVILITSKLVLRKFKRKIDLNKWMDIVVIGLSLSLCAILLRKTFEALNLPPVICYFYNPDGRVSFWFGH